MASSTTANANNPDPILFGFEFEFLVAQSKKDHHPADGRWRVDTDQTPAPKTAGFSLQSGNLGPPSFSFKAKPTTKGSKPAKTPIHKVTDKAEELLEKKGNLCVLTHKILRLSQTSPKEFEEAVEKVREKAGFYWRTNHVSNKYQGYTVVSDNSLHNTADKKQGQLLLDTNYGWIGVEVRSRVFHENDFNNGQVTEVDLLCSVLRAEMRLQINHTCALQVTVSRQTSKGYNLLDLKKILTLVWVLEPWIYQLCAPYRQNQKHCFLISQYSELATMTQDTLKNMVPSWEYGYHVDEGVKYRDLMKLRGLWNSRTEVELQAKACRRYGFAPKGKLGVSLNISPDGVHMIEFRMPEGTLDPGLARMWATVFVKIAKVASLGSEEYKERLSGFMKRTNTTGAFTWQEMLQELRVPKEHIKLWGWKEQWFAGSPYHEPRPWAIKEGKLKPFLPKLEDDDARFEV
ncbi:hypothetical protein B0H66DRAFT_631791 [Apodospora peruviana]|uniref:Uncharacterized protein n=1 Tax=Apodospora peruviana TaxID=516989 RepID=A0AAE0HU38_9PEZI|nr:hypothetical protein B0H66DRAFT_631791 [Apodospora peruviana]